MKYLLLFCSVSFFLFSCDNNDIDPPISPENSYIFEGFVNGVEIKSDSLKYYPSSNSIVFGDSVPHVMLSIDTLYEGVYTDFQGFQGCLEVRNPTGSKTAWCSSAPNAAISGTLEITSLNDSVITANIDYVLFTDKMQDEDGNYIDSTFTVTGVITGLDLSIQ